MVLNGICPKRPVKMCFDEAKMISRAFLDKSLRGDYNMANY